VARKPLSSHCLRLTCEPAHDMRGDGKRDPGDVEAMTRDAAEAAASHSVSRNPNLIKSFDFLSDFKFPDMQISGLNSSDEPRSNPISDGIVPATTWWTTLPTSQRGGTAAELVTGPRRFSCVGNTQSHSRSRYFLGKWGPVKSSLKTLIPGVPCAPCRARLSEAAEPRDSGSICSGLHCTALLLLESLLSFR
jgi:hypothetical protein